jgi:dipeptidase E
MKLLLTSSGITNPTLKSSLLELTSKPFNKMAAVFIPTAASVEAGDKSWLIENLIEIRECVFKKIDIVDIALIKDQELQSRLAGADVIFVGGGNNFYLAQQIHQSGLAKELSKLLKNKVYVGISAGSCVTGQLLNDSLFALLYPGEENIYGVDSGLGLVDFCILPHLNSLSFPNLREQRIAQIVNETKLPIYAIDDETAIQVVNGDIKFVGEGKHLRYN